MKKQITVLLALMLVFTFVLAACGKSKPTEEANTINLPVIDAGDQVETEPAIEPALPTEQPAAAVEEAYPIDNQAVNAVDPFLAYPIDPASPSYDTEMEAFLTILIGEKHDLQFLLDKDLTAEQWREILLNENHAHLMLSEGPLQAVIDWLISK
ncbi:MAG: hypothetical protein PHW11_01140 [Anaerolineaceae bacterium]|jgi:predicted small lipoprotein YifL|nr:hypothetical protein [Anaerolineaceae bacterium]MDD4043180.1 hypothetical protein [Anaerolineaceae bacterium]MDD4578641.1 hypothetical protein [Anaerolineaceae bacterium]